ncbi:hypothetical protein AURDEDRAFT_174058 [Auricularia subglabra TFB-10046 SS5]|nr:hypothetical protein AURDEDRAFT_174058 [Auricularia subglabra TFB-10046 SS5]
MQIFRRSSLNSQFVSPHDNMRVASLIVAAVAAAIPTHAFIAWSGSHCDGDKGATAEVARGETGCVSMWTSTGCIGQRFNFTNQQYMQCTNVNTGTNIQSFRCATGNVQGCPEY